MDLHGAALRGTHAGMSAERRPATRAMILAAGKGTRLLPLTLELPKPLMPVGDRPLLAHLAARLARAGYESFAVNIHHLAHEFVSGFNALNSVVHVLREVEIRGTAGGVAGARGLFGAPPVLVWNGDVLVEPPIAELLTTSGQDGLGFAVAPRPKGTGTVGVDADGHVVRLRGELFGSEAAGGDYVGVAALGGAVLAALPERGCLVADVALPLLRAGGTIATAAASGGFIDIGSIASYHRANQSWLLEHVGQGASWVAPTASIGAGVGVSSSVVGAGATVSGAGELVRCVVWPGAHAVAPLVDSIVTTSGRVVVAS